RASGKCTFTKRLPLLRASTLEQRSCRLLVFALSLELGFYPLDLALELSDARFELGDTQRCQDVTDSGTGLWLFRRDFVPVHVQLRGSSTARPESAPTRPLRQPNVNALVSAARLGHQGEPGQRGRTMTAIPAPMTALATFRKGR